MVPRSSTLFLLSTRIMYDVRLPSALLRKQAFLFLLLLWLMLGLLFVIVAVVGGVVFSHDANRHNIVRSHKAGSNIDT